MISTRNPLTDEQKLYTHTHYIWHRVVLRAFIMLPILILKILSQVSLSLFEALFDVFDEMLPAHYKQTKVTFDQLSKGEQEAIERIAKARGAILSQVQT